MSQLYTKMQALRLRLGKYLPVIFFFGGFAWDAYTIGNHVAVSDLLIFAAYILGAALIMYLISRPSYILADESKLHPRLHWIYSSSIPYFLLQFLFGSLLSALFIWYFESASHLSAFFVAVLLGGLLVANEHWESKYKHFTLSWALFGLCTMLFCNFALPFLLGSVYAAWFYLSTLIGASLVGFLYKKTPQHLGRIFPVWCIAGALMLAYWFDMIPPVPLVKRDIAMAYNVEHIADDYRLTQQASAWWVFWRNSSDDLHISQGQRVYCYSSIFAPAGLKTKLYHNWQIHTKQGWITQSNIGFGLNGGRQYGYRGYTYKSNLSAGEWRVRVETENQKTITIYNFTVDMDADKARKIMQLY
jgi:MFS family permease